MVILANFVFEITFYFKLNINHSPMSCLCFVNHLDFISHLLLNNVRLIEEKLKNIEKNDDRKCINTYRR